MRYAKRFFQVILPLLLLAAAGAGLVLWLTGERQQRQQELLGSMGFLGDTTGFSVTAGEGGDFPGPSGLSQEELKARLEEVLALADKARFSTVFFQVRADGAAFYESKYTALHPSLSGAKGVLGGFDPLGYLCDRGLEERVLIYAVADVSDLAAGLSQKETAARLADSTAELGRKYPLGGILLTGLDSLPPETVKTALSAVRSRLEKEGTRVPLGLLFDGEGNVTPQLISDLTGDGTLDAAAPRIAAPVSPQAGERSFEELLSLWSGAVAPSTRLLVVQPGPDPEGELRLLMSSLEERVSGVMLEHYGSLRGDPSRIEAAVSLLTSPRGGLPSLSFPIPRTLSVSYPDGDVSVSDAAIFLMGTSDPEKPLTLDGEELERRTAGGTWGSLQKLEPGKNTFTLGQGEETATVTVTRYTPGGSSPISGLTEGSLFPRYSCGVDSDGELTLSCMGPAGGTVTATLNGKSLRLSQAESASQNGTPVAFRGTMTLSPVDYDPNATASIGAVTYLLRYGGAETSYRSQGEVYVAGRNVPLVVENTAQLSAVLTDPDDDDSIIGSLKPGAVAQVEKTVRTSRSGAVTLAYKLRGSGYILAGTPAMGPMVRVVEGDPSTGMTVDSSSAALGRDGSLTLTLGEGTPAVLTSRTDDSLILDCLDTTVAESCLSTLRANDFIRSAAASPIQNGSRITLELEPEGGLWGYDLYYEAGKTVLYLKPAPKRSEVYGKPLTGITVMLDAGHGGSDPGAMGVAGTGGPAEAPLNLAVACATKYRLEQLGAAVTLTRQDDSQVSLYERVDASTAARPDLFLSIHHNSGVLTGNMNQARRMECYYFEDISQPFAEALMARLPEALGRPGTEPEQARYYVTRQTGNPAALLEVGFIVNPLEYEECVDRVNILKTACAVAEAVMDVIPER